jgi:hypothetical protein
MNVVSEVLQALKEVLSELLDQKVSEVQFMVPDNYGKFVVSIDDMIPQVSTSGIHPSCGMYVTCIFSNNIYIMRPLFFILFYFYSCRVLSKRLMPVWWDGSAS